MSAFDNTVSVNPVPPNRQNLVNNFSGRPNRA
jgi:hypothetical protein